jgi:hypothetical protein
LIPVKRGHTPSARRANNFVLSELGLAYVKPAPRKYLASVFRNNVIVSAPSRSHKRGVRVVTNVERGMRWTFWPRQTSAAGTDGEGVWSRSPDAGIKFAGDEARGRRWLESPAHRGERAISRKPLRRECRLFRLPCGFLRAQSAFLLHARLAGAASIRHSLRPLCGG